MDIVTASQTRAWILCFAFSGLLACDDSPVPAADARPDAPVADTDGGAADGPTPDTTPAIDGPLHDGPPTTCSEAIVGTKCTPTGGECGADHTCLLVSATAGFCTCACTPEDFTTPTREDSCPGSKLVCARYTPQGGNEQRYCFQFLGNVPPGCSDKLTHNWDTPFAFAYANMELALLTPASAPFIVVGVRYLLGGTGMGGSIPCDSIVPHRVDLWVDTSTTPASTPALAATVQAAPATQSTLVATSISLGSPLRLESGEHLFVAVEMSNKVNDKAMCIATCGGGTTGEKSFTSWTNATVNNSPPYSWKSYKAMGSTQELSTLALGFEG
jgi:hypothetical protein